MNPRDLEDSLKDTIVDDGKRSSPNHHFHPSQITGCPLKVHLDQMTRNETILNSWLFQGSAVHYYLQESGLMDQALKDAGYHPATIEYEKNIKYPITDDVWINGTCDILVEDDGSRVIYDIKYSSIPVESGHPRLYKYYSQANTYAQMFGADDYGLIMINSRSQELRQDIHILEGELSDENWDIVTNKALNIRDALQAAGYYDEDADVVWQPETLEDVDVGFWEEVVAHFDKQQIPSYDKECKYCDHSEYCPVKQGKLGGINQIIEDNKN